MFYNYPAIVGYTYATSSKYYEEDVPACLVDELNSIEFSSGTYYRGMKTSRLLGEIEGNIWKPKGICSASKDISIAKTFAVERFPSRVSVILIMGKARDIENISAHPREKEVMFYNQSFTIRYLGRRQDLDIWGAKEVGLKTKPANNPAKEYPFPTMEECQNYIHKPTYKPKGQWVGNLPSNTTQKKCKELNPGSEFSLYYWSVVDSIPSWATSVGEVEVYQHKKGKEIWTGYKGKEFWCSDTDYYLQKDKVILHLKVNWYDDKYDKYHYYDEDVFI